MTAPLSDTVNVVRNLLESATSDLGRLESQWKALEASVEKAVARVEGLQRALSELEAIAADDICEDVTNEAQATVAPVDAPADGAPDVRAQVLAVFRASPIPLTAKQAWSRLEGTGLTAQEVRDAVDDLAADGADLELVNAPGRWRKYQAVGGGVASETVEEFLSRGGHITKVPGVGTPELRKMTAGKYKSQSWRTQGDGTSL